MKKVLLPENFTDLSDEEKDLVRRKIITDTMRELKDQIPTFGKILCFTEKLTYDDKNA